MKHSKILTVASALLAIGVISVAGYGCGDDDSASPTKDGGGVPEGSTTETGTDPDSGGGNPAPPTLGAQIDRMGRPAINTALNATFEADATKKAAAKDKWNQDTNVATWKTTWTPVTSGNLGVLDALNDVCGDQAFADPDSGTNVGRYGTFGGVAADDRLWIKMDAMTCSVYLAVEANATGFLANMDCGGRGLAYDVIDVTYSLAAGGTPVSISSVTDGIGPVAAKTGGTTFPFLADPVQ